MASNHGMRRAGWDQDEASDSRQRDRKRKREKADKKERKEKEREYERDRDREREQKSDRKKREWEASEKELRDQKKRDQKAAEAHKSKRPRESAQVQTPPSSGGGRTAALAPSEDAAAAPQRAANWRREVESNGPAEDERDFSDDEETTQRKLEESRKRREAMMAKWVNKDTEGPEDKGAGADDGADLARTASRAPTAEDGGSSAGEAVKSDKEEIDEAAREKKREVQSFILQAKREEEAAGDMFDTSAGAEAALKGGLRQSAAISLTGASGEDWDDQEGYYLAKVGEVLDDRYLVYETVCGRGVFSNVVKAKDRRAEGEVNVAIKIIRSNDMMKKAAEKEIEILQKLNSTDKGDRRHVVRLLETFYYRKHIFLVFECMWDDLRAALKKYTKNKGMSLQAVRAYTKQLLIGVRHMHRFQIIHADIKPDNILISEGNNIVKLCDLGTAVELKDITVSPYLMSRFYRPAEVVLGCEYGLAVDVWALACTLYEIFTGKTLLTGKTNNDMLKKIMEVKGKIPKHIIKKGAVWKQHFDENLDFKYEDNDKVTGEKIMRTLTDLNVKRELKDLILERVGPEKRQSQENEDQQYVKKSIHFSDLLEKTLALDPEKRLTAEDALKHHFLAEPANAKAAAAAAARR